LTARPDSDAETPTPDETSAASAEAPPTATEPSGDGPPAASAAASTPPLAPPSERPKLPWITIAAAAGVIGLVGLAIVSSQEGEEPAPEVAQVTPTPVSKLRPQFKLKSEPLKPIEPKPARPRDLVRRAPVPALEPSESQDGFLLFQEAVAGMPEPSHAARKELQAVGQDFRAHLGEEGQRYLRAAWPSIQLFQRAARSDGFARQGKLSETNLAAPRHLALAALALGRMDLRSGATAKGLRWSLYVIALGRKLGAGSQDLLEVAQGVGLARLGEVWLDDALQKREWNYEELAWLRDRLAELPPAPPALAKNEADPAPMQALYAKSLASEESALAKVRERAKDMLAKAKPSAGGAK
tara:strand:+ start:175 stop:1239 length:1065 start_codon:yes stop_codon:yes gene_type:complete